MFADVFFAHHCQLPFSSMHHEMFRDYKPGERGRKRATAAPRGYAKSTVQALIEPIHDLCYGLENFIVIISNTEAQALQRSQDIRTELLTNEALIRYFGPFFGVSKIAAKGQFEVTGRFGAGMVQAYGKGTEIRGIKYGPHRPSKIIGDDLEHSTEVENEAIRRKDHDWFNDVVQKLGDANTNISIVGTILHKDSLLANLIKNPGFKGKIYRAIAAWDNSPEQWNEWRKIFNDLTNEERERDAWEYYCANKNKMLEGVEVLWDQKESYYYLQKMIVEQGRRSFFKEKQNDPRQDESNIFQMNKLSMFHVKQNGDIFDERTEAIIPKGDIRQRFGVLDPSAGQGRSKAKGKLGDFACLLSGVQDKYGYLYVMEDWTRRVPPTRQISSIFDFWEHWRYDKFGIETNLYRNLMMDDIAKEKRRREEQRRAARQEPWGINIAFYDIENTDKKESRIYSLEPKIMNGFIKFNRSLSEEFFNQLEAFPKGDHDDCPDALHMLWSLADRRYEARAVNINALAR